MMPSRKWFASMVFLSLGTSALRVPLKKPFSAWRRTGNAVKGEGKRDNQTNTVASHKSVVVPGKRDLVLMHVPYNFGHTVEKVAMFTPTQQLDDMWKYLAESGGMLTGDKPLSWASAKSAIRPNGEVWGHMHPDLQNISRVTGCNLYYTPQKYWPQDLANKYFGNKTIFGMLRDPAERLVAMFRGNVMGYGGGFDPEYHADCDVNSAVKQMLTNFKASGNKFYQSCTFLPQADYFEGRYGIKLPVDNRRFPASMREVFQEHGYTNMQINTKDILHVSGCNDAWSGDLDGETKKMIRELYAKDYELLCKHFNYCNPDENTCISGVPGMCPSRVQQEMKRKQRFKN